MRVLVRDATERQIATLEALLAASLPEASLTLAGKAPPCPSDLPETPDGELIRELSRANESLEKKVARLEAANQAKNEFLANMSHEIRTPINGIMGSAEVLKMSQLDEEQGEFLGYIRTSVGTLFSIIDNILDFSKIEAGMIELEELPFSLRRCLGEAVGMQIPLAGRKGLALNTRIAAEIRDDLVGDQLRLKQVLLNLLSNAVKFTEQGEITLSVARIDSADAPALIRFSVSDTGIGMGPEVLEKVFAPFVQADAGTARKYGGSGLGLAICAKFVQLMKGRIWAESQEGASSTFHFEIPFEHPGERTGGECPAQPQPELPWEGPRLHLVVAEDNEIDRKLTTWMLRDICHTVETAVNGAEAIALCRQGEVDCVLMDVQMPSLDGIEACRTIREAALQKGKRLPVIALTAYALKSDRESFLSLGFDGYLSKPVSSGAMQAEIRRCLQQTSGKE